MRRSGREDVTSVEGGRHGLERVAPVGDLERHRDAAEPLGRGNEEAVVGTDEQATVAAANHEGPSRRPDPRIDHGEVDSLGHVGKGVRQNEGSLQDTLRLDPVRDVDHVRVRRDSLDDTPARTREVILDAEVGQKSDEHGPRR
jgi:hypothetical protein